jgi:hypothetical protein
MPVPGNWLNICMRFFEFRSPIIDAAEPSSVANPLQKLADIVKTIDPSDPLYNQAIDIMQLGLSKADNAVEKSQPNIEVPVEKSQPNIEVPVEKSQPNIEVPVEEKLDTAVKKTKPAAKKNLDDESVYEAYLNAIQDPIERMAMAKDAEFKNKMLNFIKIYENDKAAKRKELTDLAGDVLSRISKGEPSDSEKDALLGIFPQFGIGNEQMTLFLQGAKEGKIIDMQKLVNSFDGIIDNHVNSVYKPVYMKVIGSFFNLADGMRTAGNIGPGEVAFVLLGNPAEKMVKGDLKVGKESFEVKASSDSAGKEKKDGSPGATKPNGAVFGAKVNQKPASAWPNVQEILNKYEIEQTTRVVTNKETGETKELERFKLNASGMTDLNAELDSMRMPKAKRAKLMSEILKQLFPKIINQDRAGFEQKVLATMNPKTGHFPIEDNGSLMKLIALTALEGYKLEKHKENFIFFNKTSRNYKVFRGTQIDDAINNDTIRLFKGIDWSDGQYPAAPKMYIS